MGNYRVLEVDEDCVQMSEFIKKKLKCEFEDRKTFYEMTENKEDLLYCKKILRPQTKEVTFKLFVCISGMQLCDPELLNG